MGWGLKSSVGMVGSTLPKYTKWGVSSCELGYFEIIGWRTNSACANTSPDRVQKSRCAVDTYTPIHTRIFGQTWSSASRPEWLQIPRAEALTGRSHAFGGRDIDSVALIGHLKIQLAAQRWLPRHNFPWRYVQETLMKSERRCALVEIKICFGWNEFNESRSHSERKPSSSGENLRKHAMGLPQMGISFIEPLSLKEHASVIINTHKSFAAGTIARPLTY